MMCLKPAFCQKTGVECFPKLRLSLISHTQVKPLQISSLGKKTLYFPCVASNRNLGVLQILLVISRKVLSLTDLGHRLPHHPTAPNSQGKARKAFRRQEKKRPGEKTQHHRGAERVGIPGTVLESPRGDKEVPVG